MVTSTPPLPVRRLGAAGVCCTRATCVPPLLLYLKDWYHLSTSSIAVCKRLVPCAVCRCESVRKAIERVFGMLKKRFRILKIPLPCHNIFQITDILHSCCILHNMILEDKDRINLGHLVDDWIDKGPDASKARRELYRRANGRVFLLNGRTHVINDSTDYMLRGNQTSEPNFCDATGERVRTHRCGGYACTRDTLVKHYSVVSNINFAGPSTDKPMWLKPAAITRPFP
jgi:hypothetical protein